MNQNQDTSPLPQNMNVLERTWHGMLELHTVLENSGYTIRHTPQTADSVGKELEPVPL